MHIMCSYVQHCTDLCTVFRIYWILGYDPSEMVGLRAYEYFHPEDLTATSSCHMNCEWAGMCMYSVYEIE